MLCLSFLLKLKSIILNYNILILKVKPKIFEGTPQQLIREVGRAEDIPDGRGYI